MLSRGEALGYSTIVNEDISNDSSNFDDRIFKGTRCATQEKINCSNAVWFKKIVKKHIIIQASKSLQKLSLSHFNKNKSPHKIVRALALKKKGQPFFFFIWKDLEILKPKKISPFPQLYSEPVKIALSFMPFELVKCN